MNLRVITTGQKGEETFVVRRLSENKEGKRNKILIENQNMERIERENSSTTLVNGTYLWKAKGNPDST